MSFTVDRDFDFSVVSQYFSFNSFIVVLLLIVIGLFGVGFFLKVDLFVGVFLVKLCLIGRLFFDLQSRLCLVFGCLILRVLPTCQDGVFSLIECEAVFRRMCLGRYSWSLCFLLIVVIFGQLADDLVFHLDALS